MAKTHILGFPRIGKNRELKKALESYWKQEIDFSSLNSTASEIRRENIKTQQDAELDFITVGDFSFYDQVLDMSALLGVIPERFGGAENTISTETYFRMARGRAGPGDDFRACEMTKWFDTNYHYLVPEFEANTDFKLSSNKIFDEIEEAKKVVDAEKVKPVIIGPLTYLWLGKTFNNEVSKLDLLKKLIPIYGELLNKLADTGVDWVQIDEPILVLDLPIEWKQAFESTYSILQHSKVKKLIATYFAGLEDNLNLATNLPIEGIHIDAVSDTNQLDVVADHLSLHKVLSVGLIEGRNIWKDDLNQALKSLDNVAEKFQDNLWVSSSCSLLHTPVDLDLENNLDKEIKKWLSFATQKTYSVGLLGKAINNGIDAVKTDLESNYTTIQSRNNSELINNKDVANKVANISEKMKNRASPFIQRIAIQKERFNLPLFPTTTIGSFPQTDEIRKARRDFNNGNISTTEYNKKMKKEISYAVKMQEEYGVDVLVHGEAERNDMVEYFGEQLNGIAVSDFGWVQSYGSRCVKPPIIYGDIERPKTMTVDWITYAQSLTKKPMKGMLTGPVTILNWSFVRNDQPLSETCDQIALAIRDEVLDLEKAGIGIIQIDEAALREGLPLRKSKWKKYLTWAVDSFKICANGVRDETQIHTHMCYSEFNDILDSIVAMDADVITIETSRSNMELLDAFAEFDYPNEIGPGVYDIHSPVIPECKDMEDLIKKAIQYIPKDRIWINPDCGLKTRNWKEVTPAITNMVKTASMLRNCL